MENNLLEMNNITKEFPGVKALNNVSLAIKNGSVHALMGENGAGKSTLMKCLFGIYKKDSGTIILDGKKVDFKNSKEALENGVAMVHQELNQALKRSVMDNIWLGRYPKHGGVIVNERKMYKDTKEIFERLNINVNPKALMSELPVSQRQMVEIAKAVSYNAKIIVFDEPTSSLADKEVEHLFRIIRQLKENRCGIIYISHKMEEILEISDYVTVMRDGTRVATEKAKDIDMNTIIKLMVGRELTTRFPPKTNKPGKIIMKVENLSSAHSILNNATFDLKEGEILGVAGLAGSGRTELLENIFGMSERSGGKILINGKIINNKNTLQSIKAGLALVTEERRANGIFAILDIRENTTISNLKKYKIKKFLLSKKMMKRDTDWAIKSMRIKTPSQKTQIRTLSGGNQQKVIFARWLLTNPEILMLDEPTRGIDVGAKYEIYQLIIEMAEKGKSIIMVSSEMPELLGVCDRIIVMSGGKIAGEVNASDTSQEEIMAYAAKYV